MTRRIESPRVRAAVAALVSLFLGACGSSSDDGGSLTEPANGSAPGAGGSDTLQLSLSGPGSVAPGSTTPYVATLTDGSGNGIDGEFIDVDVNAGSTNPEIGGNTDNNGEFVFNYLAENETGSDAITATLTRDGDTVTQNGSAVRDTLSLRIVAGTFDFNAPTAPDGGTPKVVFEGQPRDRNSGARLGFVWSEGGQAVSNENVDLNLGQSQIGGGFLVGDSTTAVSSASVTVQDGDFDPEVRIVAGSQGGIQTILAEETNGTESASLDVQFVGKPDTIQLSPQSAEVEQNSATEIIAVVKDSDGTTVPDIDVDFAIAGCAGTTKGEPCESPERGSPESGRTDFDGKTKTIYFSSNSNTGAAEIEAVVNNNVRTNTAVQVTSSE